MYAIPHPQGVTNQSQLNTKNKSFPNSHAQPNIKKDFNIFSLFQCFYFFEIKYEADRIEIRNIKFLLFWGSTPQGPLVCLFYNIRHRSQKLQGKYMFFIHQNSPWLSLYNCLSLTGSIFKLHIVAKLLHLVFIPSLLFH